MPRAYWKGYLRLSLVTCPIELFPATSQAEKTHFHQINTSTGNRLRQQMVDEETGRAVDKDHKGRGYEISKGHYVPIEEDELEGGRDRKHAHGRHRRLRAEARDRQALSRQAVLHRAGQQGRRRSLRRDPRRDEGQGPRGAGEDRDGAPRAHHRARAARQGPARHHAAVRLRGARREALFRDGAVAARRAGHGQARRPYPRNQGDAVRSRQVQGRVRDGAEEADPPQGQGQDHRGAGAARRSRTTSST